MPDAYGNIKGIRVPELPWLRPHAFAPSTDHRYAATCRKCGRTADHGLHAPHAASATVYR